jgi:hypothetical protein
MARDRDLDDDYDDRPARRGDGAALSGMDSFLNNTVVAVLLALVSFFCCPFLGLILGGIGMATCKNPDSKRNAMIVLVASVLALVLNIALYATGVLDFNNPGQFGAPK